MRDVFLTIVRHESRSLSRDRTALLLVVALSLTISYAVLHGANELRRDHATLQGFLNAEAAEVAIHRQRDAEMIARIDRGEFREMPEWNNDPAFTPIYADWDFRIHRSAVYPDFPLAFLATGQRDVYPAGYYPDVPGQYFRETIPSAERDDNPLAIMIGHFDLAFVIQYLLPLFIIAMSYDLLASEKESGVLGLLLSQPVSVRSLVLAKIAVRWIMIVGTSLVLIVTTTMLVRVEWSRGTWFLFGLWMVAVMGYAVCWCGIALVVNALGKSAAANAVTLAVVWLALVLLVPAGARFAAKVMAPVPPQSELRNTKRDAIMHVGVDLYEQGVKQLDDEQSLSSAIMDRYFASHPDLHLSSLPLPDQHFEWVYSPHIRNTSDGWRNKIHQQRFHLMSSARVEEISRIIAADQQRFNRQYTRQHTLFARAGVLSPDTLVEQVLTSLSGTTAAQHDRFMQQVNRNSNEWRYSFTRRCAISELIRPEDFDHFPYFAFEPETASEVASRTVGPLMLLLIMAAVTNVTGFVWLFRYSVAT